MTWNLAFIGEEAAFARSQVQGGQGPTGPRRGGTWDRPAAGVRIRPQTTHSSPWQGFRGPLRCLRSPCEQLAGWVGIPRITHPVYPPRYHTPTPYTLPAAHREQAVRRPCGSANTLFQDTVGEPRGSRTHPSISLQNPDIEVLEAN